MDIPGLKYVAGFVSDQDEAALLAAVDAPDAEPWLADLKRRVRHHGYRYDYKARQVDPSMFLGPLPVWARPLAARLVAEGHMPAAPDQLIINEYQPGQGISAHVDCVPCFGPVICSISLGSACEMKLSDIANDTTVSLWLERGSLLVLAGAARHAWRHAIPGRKFDVVNGRKTPRGRRVSLTFRTVMVASRADG